MLGEGMPWHIILIFFTIGILWGYNNGKRENRKDHEPADRV
jgi:hypothetical protein